MSRQVVFYVANQSRKATSSHGQINFSLGLASALPLALTDRFSLTLIINEDLDQEFDRSTLRSQDQVVITSTPKGKVSRLMNEHFDLRRRLEQLEADVVILPKGYLTHGLPSGVATVSCLHDDIPYQESRDKRVGWKSRLRSRYFTTLTRRSLQKATLCVFVSSFARDQLAALYPNAPGIRGPVIYEGLSVPRQIATSTPTSSNRVILFGSSHPHKNTAAGLSLLNSSKVAIDEIDEIVIVGGKPSAFPSMHHHRITMLPGPLSNGEVVEVVQNSRALIFPSTYEGFGLPPLEAFAVGTPAVYARTGVSEEVMPGFPCAYMHPDQDSFDAALKEALSLDNESVIRLAADIQTRFTWEATANRLAEAISMLALPERPAS